MKSAIKQTANASDASRSARQVRGRKTGAIAIALMFGAWLGAGLAPTSASGTWWDNVERHYHPPVISPCAAQDASAECAANIIVYSQHMLPDRISKMFPTYGL